MNTHAGYSKKTLDNTNVLLAGGGDKSLADFIGGIQYVSASQKILYRAADTNTWTDLVTLVNTDENVRQIADDTSTSWGNVLIEGTNNSVPTSVRYCTMGGLLILPSTGRITAIGQAYFNDTANFNDDTNYSGTARFGNDVKINGSLENHGETHLYDRLIVGSTIDAGNNSFIIGNITASGTVRTNGDLITHNVKPLTSDTYNIGNSSKYYKSLYASNIFSKFISTNNNYILKPLGGDYRSDSLLTGTICITLPLNIGYGTISMWIDVATTHSSFSVYVSGNANNLNNSAWDFGSAVVYGAQHTVYLGESNDGLRIYIGDTNNAWYRPNISIRDVTIGVNSDFDYLKKQWSITFEQSMSNINSSSTIYAVLNTDLSGYLTSQDHYRTSPGAGTAGTSSATSGSTISIPYITVNEYGHVTAKGTHTHTVTGFLTSQDHYKTSITAGTVGTSSATSGSTLDVPYVTFDANGHVTGYGTHTHTITGFIPEVYTNRWGGEQYTFDESGLRIQQTSDESSGIQFNGNYINIWSPCDGYSLRCWDEDSGTEIWNITDTGLFSGSIDWTHVINTPSFSNTQYYLTLNGTVKGTPNTTNLGSFYAPTSSGTSGQYLKSNGSGSAPTWDTFDFASSSHSHTLSMATTTDSSSIKLVANTKYKLTAGGSTYIFTTPSLATDVWVNTTGDTMTGNLTMSAAWIITPGNDSYGIRPASNNCGKVGDSSYYFYQGYITNMYSNYHHKSHNNDDAVLLAGGGYKVLTDLYANLWGGALITDLNSTSMNRNRVYWYSDTASNKPTSDPFFGTVLQISNVDNPSNGTTDHWISQLDFVHDGSLYYRSRINRSAWLSWKKVLTSENYTDYISGSSFSLNHQRINDTTYRYVLGTTKTNTTSASLDGSTLYSMSAFYFTSNGAYHSSDARMKYDISDILDDDINKLFETENGFIRHFKWKETDTDAYGFIAQELKEYCPEAVNLNEDDGHYAVDYNVALSKMVGVLFKKIKLQDIEIKKLKEIIENRK